MYLVKSVLGKLLRLKATAACAVGAMRGAYSHYWMKFLCEVCSAEDYHGGP